MLPSEVRHIIESHLDGLYVTMLGLTCKKLHRELEEKFCTGGRLAASMGAQGEVKLLDWALENHFQVRFSTITNAILGKQMKVITWFESLGRQVVGRIVIGRSSDYFQSKTVEYKAASIYYALGSCNVEVLEHFRNKHDMLPKAEEIAQAPGKIGKVLRWYSQYRNDWKPFLSTFIKHAIDYSDVHMLEFLAEQKLIDPKDTTTRHFQFTGNPKVLSGLSRAGIFSPMTSCIGATRRRSLMNAFPGSSTSTRSLGLRLSWMLRWSISRRTPGSTGMAIASRITPWSL